MSCRAAPAHCTPSTQGQNRRKTVTQSLRSSDALPALTDSGVAATLCSERADVRVKPV
jgi:hypothetical protein